MRLSAKRVLLSALALVTLREAVQVEAMLVVWKGIHGNYVLPYAGQHL